jgi:hypothetical protein
MSPGVPLLIAGYVLLALLLLSLNLRSVWRWWVKGGAIVVTVAFFALSFLAIQALLGRPTAADPPARFQLHAALIEEPDRGGEHPGAIYLWLTEKDAQGIAAGLPRAHALPYSRDLHQSAAQALAQIKDGQPIEGRTRKGAGDALLPRPLQVELFTAPPVRLPDKTSG